MIDLSRVCRKCKHILELWANGKGVLSKLTVEVHAELCGWTEHRMVPRLGAIPFFAPHQGLDGKGLPVKLFILGATGRTGTELLRNALAQGHEVVTLVRNPDKVTAVSPALSVVGGSLERAQDFEDAMTGCEAVLVALNNNRASDMPWARPVSPPHLMEMAVRNSVAAMARHGIRRIVIQSAAGVGDSFAASPGIMRWLIRRTNLGHTYRDHDAVDSYIRTTDTDWTLLRPVGLTNAVKEKKLVVSYANDPRPGMTISRTRVARYMLDCLKDDSFHRQSPTLSER